MRDQFILSVEAVDPLRKLHEEIRQQFEYSVGGVWRVTEIKGSSISSYGATLASRMDPEYILTQVLAEFDIFAVENGPEEEMIEGIPVRIPRMTTYFKAYVLGNGSMRVTQDWIRQEL